MSCLRHPKLSKMNCVLFHVIFISFNFGAHINELAFVRSFARSRVFVYLTYHYLMSGVWSFVSFNFYVLSIKLAAAALSLSLRALCLSSQISYKMRRKKATRTRVSIIHIIYSLSAPTVVIISDWLSCLLLPCFVFSFKFLVDQQNFEKKKKQRRNLLLRIESVRTGKSKNQKKREKNEKDTKPRKKIAHFNTC